MTVLFKLDRVLKTYLLMALGIVRSEFLWMVHTTSKECACMVILRIFLMERMSYSTPIKLKTRLRWMFLKRYPSMTL